MSGVCLRSVAIPPPLVPAVVVADTVARRLDGVGGLRAEPTLRAPRVSRQDIVVPVDVELVGYFHEGETVVQPL